MRAFDEALLALLACPADHAALVHDESAEQLCCTSCGRRYPVVDGMPVLLLDKATAGPEQG